VFYALVLVDSALSLIRPIVPETVAVITRSLRDTSARSPLDTIAHRRYTASVLWPVSVIATLRYARAHDPGLAIDVTTRRFSRSTHPATVPFTTVAR
jgi:hypothetical protein